MQAVDRLAPTAANATPDIARLDLRSSGADSLMDEVCGGIRQLLH